MGRSVGKIRIINLSFRVDTSKNKNIDHRVKETSAQLVFSVFHCDLKEKYPIRKKYKLLKKGKFSCEINITQKLGSVGPVQQKIKLPSP